MTMRIRLTAILTFLASGALMLLVAHPAFAQADGGAGTFSCSGGVATGSLYSSGLSCPTSLSFDHLFSFLACNMEQLSSNLLGNMFCGMITGLAPAVGAVLVLAVMFFGMAFTIGLIPATAREFQIFLFKIAFVWAFATQSDYLIGYGYAFFINGIRDGVAIGLSGYHSTSAACTAGGGNCTTGSDVYNEMDAFLANFVHYATDYIGLTPSASDPNAGCKNALFAVLAIMAVAFPPIFMAALVLIGKMAMTFVRAVFGYIYAMVGIAFLMTLAPFFLSFFLFKQTKPFFDKWIGYLASFALQIVILFAFLSFLMSIDVSSITGNIPSIIIAKSETPETVAFRAPWEYCTLCDFQVVDKTTNAVIPPNQTSNFLSNGKLQCTSPSTPISALNTATPLSSGQQSTLLKFAGGSFLILVVLVFLAEALLNSIAPLAQTLAAGLGAYAAPQLGGGWSASGRTVIGMPGEGLIEDAGQGFEHGFHRSSDSISGTVTGVKDSMRRLILGQEAKLDTDGHALLDKDGNVVYKQLDGAGMPDRFMNWLVDPNQLSER